MISHLFLRLKKDGERTMSIFKASDIRGPYPEEINEEVAYKIGFTFASSVKSSSLVVAQDNRLSSASLARSLLKGITDSGKNVIYLGEVDSPGLYFASGKYNMPGVMVTASHNPAQYNGFYLVDKGARPIYQKNGLKKIEKLFARLKTKENKNMGRVTKVNIKPAYKKYILDLAKKYAPNIHSMKIVLDTGNGAGSIMAKEIFDAFPQVKVIPLFFELDGHYPNRGPDPTVEKNLEPLRKKVVREKADFGLAFDADADRVALVDENGNIVPGSIIGCLLAENMLNNMKKEKIICSIGCTRALREIIEKHKSQYIREKVGHSFISDHMRKVSALLGIEQTGHFFYRSTNYAECPMLTSLILCHIFSQKKKPMSEIMKPYQKYYMTQEINFPVTNSKEITVKLKKYLKKAYKTKIDTFDGLYIETPQLWFRIRPSQTEPALRLTLEGMSKSAVDAERKKLHAIIRSFMKE
jgi:phosphomannomutase